MSGPAVEHTPTPWSVYEDMDRIAAPTELFVRTSTMGQYKSASLTNDRGEFHNPADAAFIVEACNSHASHLLALAKAREALEKARDWIHHDFECELHVCQWDANQLAGKPRQGCECTCEYERQMVFIDAALLSLPPQTVTK